MLALDQMERSRTERSRPEPQHAQPNKVKRVPGSSGLATIQLWVRGVKAAWFQ